MISHSRIFNRICEHMRFSIINIFVLDRIDNRISIQSYFIFFYIRHTLRLGGKKIIKYSLALLSDREKLEFLSDFYDSIVNHEFDTEILNFISQQIENAEKRKKISNERRKLKKQQEKEEATKRTIAAASSLIEETMSQSLPRYAQI